MGNSMNNMFDYCLILCKKFSMQIKIEVDAKMSMELCCKLRADGGERRSDLAHGRLRTM